MGEAFIRFLQGEFGKVIAAPRGRMWLKKGFCVQLDYRAGADRPCGSRALRCWRRWLHIAIRKRI